MVLAIYLTNGVPCLGRFPINFKSELPARAGMSQKYFYHVVLGLAHGNRFGAIGLRFTDTSYLNYFPTFSICPQLLKEGCNRGHGLLGTPSRVFRDNFLKFEVRPLELYLEVLSIFFSFF